MLHMIEYVIDQKAKKKNTNRVMKAYERVIEKERHRENYNNQLFFL